MSPPRKPEDRARATAAASRLVGAACAAVLIGACAPPDDGRELVGKWEPVDGRSQNAPIAVEKNGDAFVIVNRDRDLRFPASWDKTTHRLNAALPLFGAVPLTYDASSRRLVFMGSEYRRESDGGPSAPAARAEAASVDPKIAEAIAFGRSLIEPKLTVCDGRTFLMLTEGDGAAAPYVGEITKPTFEADGMPIGAADTQNGIDFKGSVDLRFETYRVVQRGKWTPWFNANSMVIGLSVRGRESVYVLHRDGHWVHEDSYIARTDFAGMKRKPIACDAMQKIVSR